MISMALKLADCELKEMEEILKFFSQLPVVFLTMLLAVRVYLTHFLAQQIGRPLNYFVGYIIRIAWGDFSSVTDTKKYKDEFSRLAMAIDWMMDQLKKTKNNISSLIKWRRLPLWLRDCPGVESSP
jgi:two-component system NtrC family sensor kinase